MKTYEVIRNVSTPPKMAEDYSEIEIFRLLSKVRENRTGDTNSYTSIVLDEIKKNKLISSAEEGQKLIKALSTFTVYNTLGEKNNEK